jgi:FkbM family methyltransferase
MTAAQLLACARARRVVPNRLARPVFWRLAARNPDALSDVVVESDVRFGHGRDLRLRLDLASRQTWPMLFAGFDESAESDMIRCFCERAVRTSCVIDVGVNHGLYLYHAIALCPANTTIVGVEANSALAESVNANLGRNGIDPLVEHVALTDRDGPVSLYIGKDDMVSSLRLDHVEGYGGALATVTVPGLRLDTLVDQRRLQPDLIKIDVEGHERAVLAGAERTMEQYRPTLLVEVTPETFPQVNAALDAGGYRGRLFTDKGLSELDPSAVAAAAYSNLWYEPIE